MDFFQLFLTIPTIFARGWGDKNVTCFLRGQPSDKICQRKESRSIFISKKLSLACCEEMKWNILNTRAVFFVPVTTL